MPKVKRRSQKKRSLLSYWPQMLFLFMVFLALFIAVACYRLYKDHSFSSPYVTSLKTKIKTVFENKKPQGLSEARSTLNTTKEEPIQFEFYTALPSMRLKLEDETVSEPVLKKAVDIAPHFIIQMGVFKSLESATQYQKSLANNDTRTVRLQNGLYRVEMGPFVLKENAHFALKQLQKNGLNGIIKKMM